MGQVGGVLFEKMENGFCCFCLVFWFEMEFPFHILFSEPVEEVSRFLLSVMYPVVLHPRHDRVLARPPEKLVLLGPDPGIEGVNLLVDAVQQCVLSLAVLDSCPVQSVKLWRPQKSPDGESVGRVQLVSGGVSHRLLIDGLNLRHEDVDLPLGVLFRGQALGLLHL